MYHSADERPPFLRGFGRGEKIDRKVCQYPLRPFCWQVRRRKAWSGWQRDIEFFGGKKFGGFPRPKFFERQERYKSAEREDLKACLAVRHDGQFLRPSFDKTGSFCGTGRKYDEIYHKM